MGHTGATNETEVSDAKNINVRTLPGHGGGTNFRYNCECVQLGITFGGDDMASNDRKAILVVAVEGLVGDWAAYQSDSYTGAGHKPVPSLGVKVSQQVAERLFPEWATTKVWRS